MSDGLAEAAVMLRVWLSPGPALMPVSGTACAGVSSLMVWGGRPEMVGGSLRLMMVRVKASLAARPLESVTVTVMIAEPVWLGSGVRVRVRLEPLPPKTMAELGMRAGLDDTAVTA